MARFIPIILAGGKGERFWPVSRLKRPKQFLCLDGSDRSLLQATADRLLPMTDWSALFVITASHLADGVRQQLPDIPPDNILVEPQGRDTAPAVTWATLEVAKRFGEDAICGFFPADHYITDHTRYLDTLKAAAELAVSKQAIATLGITPTFPSTGYGYIEQGTSTGSFTAGAGMALSAYTVARFTEKPNQATAQKFLDSGRYSWNSGIFIFPAAVMLSELKTHAPKMTQALMEKGVEAYAELDKLSIDYAVMEKTDKAYVMPADFGWDDLGDWNAIERLQQSLNGDSDNVAMCDHVGLDTIGSVLYSDNPDELIVTIGVEDVVVVRDGNATLIVKKDRTQDIKQAVKTLGKEARFQHLL
ncbi:MAG: mannose-1-phosphate guanylyltransferase [Cyanobacteria bacterium P01_D01_bin.105]